MLGLILRASRVGRLVLMDWLWSTWYNALLRIHPGVSCAGWIRVTGRMHWLLDARSTVRIGHGVRIHSGHGLNPVGGHRRTIISTGPGGHLSLMDGCGLSSSTIVCMDQVEVGARTLLGGGSEIYDSDFHSLDHRQRQQPGNPGAVTRPIRIGADCFIGAGAMLLKGADVGDRAIVGARALVTGMIPADSIWAGNPARQISPKAAS